MRVADRAEQRLTQLWADPPGIRGWLATADHKRIGLRYLVTAIAFLIVGGIEALVMRWQLTRPGQQVLDPETYDQVFTMHGLTMIFWYAEPILFGFVSYLLPLLVGARDTALPRLNALSYWVFLLSGLFLYAAPLIGEAPHAGWFAYTPFSGPVYSPGLGMDFYCLALVFLAISTIAGAVVFIVTLLRHRAPGMSLGKMPLMGWSSLATSAVIVFSLPPLVAACTGLELDRQWGFRFFDSARGGDALLWQHLFWFFGHPWVYVLFLPATGMVSVMLPTYARRTLVGYRWVAFATVATAAVGFLVWVHHMFANHSGLGGMGFFSAASMVLAVFTTIQVFAWIATLARGRVVMTAAMWYVLGFIGLLVIAGLSGVVTAVIPLDWQVTDTYFVVAHLHYALVGANVFPVFAAIHHWFPKMTGRRLDERLGKISFATMFVGFNTLFFPMFAAGLEGMPRRIYTYSAWQGWGDLALVSTIGALVLTAGIIVSVVNVIVSLRRGDRAGPDPWRSDSLEWSTDSPPAPYDLPYVPSIASKSPLWDDHDEADDPHGDRVLDQGRIIYATTPRHAKPAGIARMARPSLMPLVVSLALTGLFAALLVKALVAAAIALAVTALATAVWSWPEPDAAPEPPLEPDEPRGLLSPAIDVKRGTYAMAVLIATCVMLLVSLVFAYVYVHGDSQPQSVPALGLLVATSLAVHVAERFRLGRIAIGVALALGAAFAVLQGETLCALAPRADASQSAIATLVAAHALYVVVGLALLAYAAVLPRHDASDRPPHRALHNAALFWHFVVASGLAIAGVLTVGAS
jgi:cytochrome c oxidase subunit I+III